MKYERTKIGQFMYNITIKGAKTLIKHKWLYYTLNFTWGLLANIIGGLITLILSLKKYTTNSTFKGCVKTNIGTMWGGFSLGVFYVRDRYSSESVDYHEIGHSYQNALYGVLWLFIVAIPSALRYLYHVYIAPKLGKTVKDYDTIWFEGSATDIGELIKGT